MVFIIWVKDQTTSKSNVEKKTLKKAKAMWQKDDKTVIKSLLACKPSTLYGFYLCEGSAFLMAPLE